MIATTRGRVMTAERWEEIADVLENYALGRGGRLSGGLVDELRSLGSAAFKYQRENRELNTQLDTAIMRAVEAEHRLPKFAPGDRCLSTEGTMGELTVVARNTIVTVKTACGLHYGKDERALIRLDPAPAAETCHG